MTENFVTCLPSSNRFAATPQRVFSIDIQRLSLESPLGTGFTKPACGLWFVFLRI